MKINKNNIDECIGSQVEPTPWHRVTQDQINLFADSILDHQSIHVDPKIAKETPFGSTIAHGFLTLSMLTHFANMSNLVVEGSYMGMNYGFDRVRFITPVKVNSNIRARLKILDIKETKPGQLNIKIGASIEIEDVDKPALIAEWISVIMVS